MQFQIKLKTFKKMIENMGGKNPTISQFLKLKNEVTDSIKELKIKEKSIS